ncbi:MAG: type II toxin-antitoxin system Phd/YefM family antitoxin [Spirochaetia bacterium]|nr:type II toxin-antitoxin system Phd/YefM family antitoxin [Spirochaetia bacterium]
MRTVNIHEAKTHLSQILDRVRHGEEVIIAKSGKPVARLSPIHPVAPRLPGRAKGILSDRFFEPLPNKELDAWERK